MQRSWWMGIATLVCVVHTGVDGAERPAHLATEFSVKPDPVFEFARKPEVSRRGDEVTISFATQRACDVTVAIEDSRGRILRHLASGVLGDNAPPPLRKGSNDQVLIWDSKDDQGQYVDDRNNTVVRVSLGLRARFERQFLWSPHRRICNQGHAPTLNAPAPFVAQPEGVYVFDGSMHDHLRLFDHEGNYIRTVYPFPSGKLDELQGVKTQVFPQSGKKLPLKGGNYRSTLLTSGTNYDANYLQQLFGLAATAMAVHNGRVALACHRLNRLATDGTTGGLPMTGPETKIGALLPRSAAFSPDGKTLYLTGFNTAGWRPNWRLVWAQGVAKIDFEKGGKMETFAGVLDRDRNKGGTGPGQFRSPVSVSTDQRGRVYVADRFNDRIQIFDPDGKHLKDLAVPGGDHSFPSEVVVNQRNGDIFVFSWYLGCHAFRKHGFHDRKEVLYHFGPFDDPRLKGEYPLPIPSQSRRGRYGGDELQGREFRATIDPWAPGDLPYIWIVAGSAQGREGSIAAISPQVLRMNPEKKILEPVRKFAAEANRHLPANSYWGNGSEWISVRPTTGELYLHRGPPHVVIDPGSGQSRIVKMPMDFMTGAMGFGPQGLAYLRATRFIARFDISADDRWREVPFDYGEAHGGRLATIPVPTPSIHHQPGLSVSVRQEVVAGYIIGKVETHDRGKDKERADALAQWKRWTPQIFPGRGGNSVVAVWDRHGKLIHADAIPGAGYVADIFRDRYGDLYMASEAQRRGYPDTLTGTFVKVRPDEKVLSTANAALPMGQQPERPPDTYRGAGHQGESWWEGAQWFYGGIGYAGKNNSTCHCPKFQTAHDYFARSYVPETGHYSVGVIDAAGNLVLRIGRYGNVDEGVPLIHGAPPLPVRKPIGGDEVALFYPAYLAVDTDRRLFIHDPGNQRLVGVKLDYHATERRSLGKSEL